MEHYVLTPRALSQHLGVWQDSSEPHWRALSQQIRLLVVDGRLTAGSRLPAERPLAEQLRVSRTTVAAAYAALRHEGYLISRQGSGSVVALPAAAPQAGMLATAGYLDLTRASLPMHPWLTSEMAAATADVVSMYDHPGYDLEGLPRLREAIADRYTERGLPTSPEEVMVTLGAQHGIALLAKTLLSRGDHVLIESPTYPHAAEAMTAAGGRLVPVGVSSDEGWDRDAIVQGLRRMRPRLAYLMPDCHNPTGASMPDDLRALLISEADRAGTVLIVDETTAEFGIEHGPVKPFAATRGAGIRDEVAERTVVTLGSAGKVLWGGLRLGWIRGPRALLRRLIVARSHHDLGTPLWEQLLVARMMPQLSGVLELRRAQLRASRDALASAVSQSLPDWHMPLVRGGVAAWIGLGVPVSSRLVVAAQDAGILLTAGPRFGHDGAFERFLRIPITSSPAELRDAVHRLVPVWEQVTGSPGAVPSRPRRALDEVPFV